ncbi:hypothetical protein GGH96_004669 [Coemansia sp. RSA 1972]|nr:hypothetical protein GGH96_004669 [Coemansia sp. RSA 1972]
MAALLRQLSPAQRAIAQTHSDVHSSTPASSNNDSTESSNGELDDTRVDLDDTAPFEQNKYTKLPPILPFSQPRLPLPLLPPPHMLTPGSQVRDFQANYLLTKEHTIGKDTFSSNIEFRDATNAVLFRETISTDYSFEDIFTQYYPDAPRSLLFYISGGIVLPKQSTLSSVFSQYNVDQLPVVIWAKMPIASDPAHTPQWQEIT